MSATTAGAVGADQLAELERELDTMHVRLAVSRAVTRDVSQWVNDDDAGLDLIVEDVLHQWMARADHEPQALDGPEGFWSRYANRIEWAPPDSGNEYRPEFCPLHEAGRFDTDAYFHAVWAAQLAELRAAGRRPQ